MVYVLGIHGFSAKSDRPLHDTAATIVKDGCVIAAVNEERLSRKKKDGSFPFRSIETVFDVADIEPALIDYVAFSDETPLWQLFHIGKYAVKTYRDSGVFLFKYLVESLERTLDCNREPPDDLREKPLMFVEHHKAHAASSFLTSPWKKASIITIDGMGDYCIGGLVGIGERNELRILRRTNGFFSPGIFYMIVTSYLGFKPGRHEGKITGLAAYGDPKPAYPAMKKLVSYNKRTMDFHSVAIPSSLNRFSLTKDEFYALESFRKLWDGFSREEIASAAQKRLEDVMLPFVRDVIRQTGISRLTVAGGVFANVKLNKLILELPEIENLYIHPNMSDAGLATGAALYCWSRIVGRRVLSPKFMKDCYLGPRYGRKSIERALKKSGLRWKKIDEPEKIIAGHLVDELIVGHYFGSMEYGPRALGNRSILATPTDPSLNERLNNRLSRTEFMPFAPSILEEHANEYLIDWNPNHYASRFMTIAYDVTDMFKEKAPAAVHLDGTARPQMVRSVDNTRYHRIINEFNEITGIPVIINTSFNMHEEPIVCTPEDAIRAFKEDAVDILVMDDYFIRKDENQ